jgi:DNA-binding MarR family transcriptional regulator
MGPAFDSDHSELIADLRELCDAVRKDYRLRERAANAPIPILRAAATLAACPGIEPSALAESLRLERSTVSNLLRDMQQQGLLRRIKLASDKRYVNLELTERGQNLLRKANRAGIGLLARAASRLSGAEGARLALALKPLLSAVRTDGVTQQGSGVAPLEKTG